VLAEIDPEVDFDSRRAVYFRQMRYGLFVSLLFLFFCRLSKGVACLPCFPDPYGATRQCTRLNGDVASFLLMWASRIRSRDEQGTANGKYSHLDELSLYYPSIEHYHSIIAYSSQILLDHCKFSHRVVCHFPLNNFLRNEKFVVRR
jgi:hypothetical protein